MNWTRICNRRHRVLRRDRTLYVWLSGTTGHAEWARNLDVRTMLVYNRRVKTELWREALDVALEVTPMLDGVKEILVAGFSRGGGLAPVVALELIARQIDAAITVQLWAPKRALSDVTGVPIAHCFAHRGDIVPYLPPWYGRLPVEWFGRCDWFWKAHNKAGHDAAKWRHDVTKG